MMPWYRAEFNKLIIFAAICLMLTFVIVLKMLFGYDINQLTVIMSAVGIQGLVGCLTTLVNSKKSDSPEPNSSITTANVTVPAPDSLEPKP
jgi:hypothetical protein